MDYKFETLVEKLKFDVLKEVAKSAYAGTLDADEAKIPIIVSPGPKTNYRCCIYMERAIVTERIKIVKGGDTNNPNVIQVIPIACDQCPMGGYTVTQSCRGCIGHACAAACPRGAITVDIQHRAHIDKTKCINCGLCAKACPFGSIYNFRRPCQKACSVGAITMDENLAAKIDNSKCISCGACLQRCPFGAINDTTCMVQLIDAIKQNNIAGKPKKVIAILAPSIASQFAPQTVGQVAEAIKTLGFTDIYEAALGADLVAMEEGKELAVKKALLSSCCPAFVDFIGKFRPQLRDKISHALSPMAQIARELRKKYADAIICFIGPCTAKKMEIKKPTVAPYVNYAITFVELRAMLAARNIQVQKLQGIDISQASSFGRNFARCGGLSDAVVEVLKELNIQDFKLSSLSCNGIKECIDALGNMAKGDTTYNFIEGMACEGGCISGPGSITHNPVRAKFLVSSHSKTTRHKTIQSATDPWTKEPEKK